LGLKQEWSPVHVLEVLTKEVHCDALNTSGGMENFRIHADLAVRDGGLTAVTVTSIIFWDNTV
jgi:hypothetical protein